VAAKRNLLRAAWAEEAGSAADLAAMRDTPAQVAGLVAAKRNLFRAAWAEEAVWAVVAAI